MPTSASHPTESPSSVPDQTGATELRERTMARVLARLLNVRRIFAPLLLVFALWIAWVDPTTWRRVILLAAVVLLVLVGTVDTHFSRRVAADDFARAKLLLPDLLIVSSAQHILLFATGGLSSPLLPLLLPMSFIMGVTVKARTVWTLALLLHLPVLWIEFAIAVSGSLELIPAVLYGPLGKDPATGGVFVTAVVMSVAIMLATLLGTHVTTGFDLMLDGVLRSRDQALHARTEQNRELSTLSAEIAHELKNPLASIKGLAQLVERELVQRPTPSKAGERMQVLGREVGRMQGILDEFLNFSRPLSPLSQREVALRELADYIVELHEGMASERRVEILVHAPTPVRCVCDPRKIEQILINLVQNALEVVDPGTQIVIVCGPVSTPATQSEDPTLEQVEILVRDQGPGLSKVVRDRSFELGVTDKATGSGLGLTIARALARQHGGELELANRQDGHSGCEARLTLPTHARDADEEPTPTHA